MIKFRKADYLVKSISHDTAVAFIQKNHYAKSASLTSVYSFGLFEKHKDFFEDWCVGVSLWMPPTKNCAKSVFDNWTKVLTLSRLAIKSDIPKNACSFLLGQSRKLIKKDNRFKCLVTFADTSQNHLGTIYKADNWEYLGLTKPTPVWVNEKGEIKGAKRASKNLTKDEMESLGFVLKGRFSKHKFRYIL